MILNGGGETQWLVNSAECPKRFDVVDRHVALGFGSVQELQADRGGNTGLLNAVLNRGPNWFLVDTPAEPLAVADDDDDAGRFVGGFLEVDGFAQAGDEIGGAKTGFEFVDLRAELA